MAKLTAALLLVFVIELCLIYFGGADYEFTSLYSFFMNPELFTSSAFYLVMLGALTVSGLAYISPGIFIQHNQWALYAGASAVAITFILSIAHLGTFLLGQLTSIVGINAASFITAMITVPLAAFYIITVVEWGRQN